MFACRISSCSILAWATLLMGLFLHGGLLHLERRLGGVETALWRLERAEVALARTEATAEQRRLSALEQFNARLLEHLGAQKLAADRMASRLKAQTARLEALERVVAQRQTAGEGGCASKYSLLSVIFEK